MPKLLAKKLNYTSGKRLKITLFEAKTCFSHLNQQRRNSRVQRKKMEWEKENKMICDVFNDLPWHVCEPVSTEDTFNTQGTNKTILANRIYPQSLLL